MCGNEPIDSFEDQLRDNSEHAASRVRLDQQYRVNPTSKSARQHVQLVPVLDVASQDMKVVNCQDWVFLPCEGVRPS